MRQTTHWAALKMAFEPYSAVLQYRCPLWSLILFDRNRDWVRLCVILCYIEQARLPKLQLCWSLRTYICMECMKREEIRSFYNTMILETQAQICRTDALQDVLLSHASQVSDFWLWSFTHIAQNLCHVQGQQVGLARSVESRSGTSRQAHADGNLLIQCSSPYNFISLLDALHRNLQQISLTNNRCPQL